MYSLILTYLCDEGIITQYVTQYFVRCSSDVTWMVYMLLNHIIVKSYHNGNIFSLIRDEIKPKNTYLRLQNQLSYWQLLPNIENRLVGQLKHSPMIRHWWFLLMFWKSKIVFRWFKWRLFFYQQMGQWPAVTFLP